MSVPIRVVVAEDQAIVRKGIVSLLATEPGIQVVGEAEDGARAVELACQMNPDVVLMDIVMPTMDGIEATRLIVANLPGTRVLVLTSFATDDKILPAMKAGALGYLLKDTGPAELLDSIQRIHRGEPSLDPAVARKLLSEVSQPPKQKLTTEPLSARELSVLRLVAKGRSNKEIAKSLAISEMTVRTHVSSILHKLHLASRTQATLYALREGLASLDGPQGDPAP